MAVDFTDGNSSSYYTLADDTKWDIANSADFSYLFLVRWPSPSSDGTLFQYFFSKDVVSTTPSLNFYIGEDGNAVDDTFIMQFNAVDNTNLRCDVTAREAISGGSWWVVKGSRNSGTLNVTACRPGDTTVVSSTGLTDTGACAPEGSVYLGARQDVNIDRCMEGWMQWVIKTDDFVTDEEQIALANGADPRALLGSRMVAFVDMRGPDDVYDVIGEEAGSKTGTAQIFAESLLSTHKSYSSVTRDAGSAATSITPTAGSLSLTGATPSVALKINVAPTAGSLSLTGATPSVTTKTNVSPTAGSLSLAGSTPSVALKLNVAPTAGSLSVTGATPGVATKTNVNVTGGTVSLTGATPGVEVVTPGVTAITVTAGSISLAGATPAVAIKLNVSPTAADLSITGATPSVNISKNISPTAGSISLAGATPAVALKLNVAPTAGTLALSGSTVTVVNTGDVAVTPARRDGGGGGRKRQQRRREFSEEELERLDVETKSVIETLYGPPTPEPAQEAPAVPDVSKERLERLVAIRDAVRQDEQKIRALGARLEDLESEITFIEARREEDSLLLLLLAVE